jgi:hypothetical protein
MMPRQLTSVTQDILRLCYVGGNRSVVAKAVEMGFRAMPKGVVLPYVSIFGEADLKDKLDPVQKVLYVTHYLTNVAAPAVQQWNVVRRNGNFHGLLGMNEALLYTIGNLVIQYCGRGVKDLMIYLEDPRKGYAGRLEDMDRVYRRQVGDGQADAVSSHATTSRAEDSSFGQLVGSGDVGASRNAARVVGDGGGGFLNSGAPSEPAAVEAATVAQWHGAPELIVDAELSGMPRGLAIQEEAQDESLEVFPAPLVGRMDGGHAVGMGVTSLSVDTSAPSAQEHAGEQEAMDGTAGGGCGMSTSVGGLWQCSRRGPAPPDAEDDDDEEEHAGLEDNNNMVTAVRSSQREPARCARRAAGREPSCLLSLLASAATAAQGQERFEEPATEDPLPGNAGAPTTLKAFLEGIKASLSADEEDLSMCVSLVWSQLEQYVKRVERGEEAIREWAVPLSELGVDGYEISLMELAGFVNGEVDALVDAMNVCMKLLAKGLTSEGIVAANPETAALLMMTFSQRDSDGEMKVAMLRTEVESYNDFLKGTKLATCAASEGGAESLGKRDGEVNASATKGKGGKEVREEGRRGPATQSSNRRHRSSEKEGQKKGEEEKESSAWHRALSEMEWQLRLFVHHERESFVEDNFPGLSTSEKPPLVLFPFHRVLGDYQHFAAAFIDLAEGIICHFDTADQTLDDPMVRWLREIATHLQCRYHWATGNGGRPGDVLSPDEWKWWRGSSKAFSSRFGKQPSQPDTVSCGAYVLGAVSLLMRGRKLNHLKSTNQAALWYRIIMVAYILTKDYRVLCAFEERCLPPAGKGSGGKRKREQRSQSSG